MIRAVFFDAVGTLIRPFPSVGAVYARVAADHGLRCRARVLERHFHPAYRALFPERFFGPSRLQTADPRERRWWRKVVARTLEQAAGRRPPPVLEAALEAFSRGAAWRPCAGAMEVLAALAGRDLKIGLVSNYDSRLHRVVLELGMAPFLGAVLVSSEVGWAKPSPRIYRAALARFGVRPEEALMVGDRMVEDFRGARAAGLHALLFDPCGRERGPHVIRSLRQVPLRLTDAANS